jgi:hypothetical protein
MLTILDRPEGALQMNDEDVLDKTDSGRDELRTRAAGLSQRARSILIMVDGVRTVGDLRVAIERLSAPADTLDSLLELALVVQTRTAPARLVQSDPAVPDAEEPIVAASTIDPERFRVAKKFMNDTVVDALGLRAFMFTLKLEKCATLADLAQLAPEYSRALVKAKGAEVAGALRTRLRELLR